MTLAPQAFPGFQGSGGVIGQGKVGSLNLLDPYLRGGGRFGDWEVEIVNVVPMMADLPFVEIAQGIAQGACGAGDEVAFGWIEMPCGVGESFLGGQVDFGVREAGDVGELACDFSSEGKKFIHPFFHDGEKLSGYAPARQVFGQMINS
jgi:hypothetical protein